jgi:hypothetical protein
MNGLMTDCTIRQRSLLWGAGDLAEARMWAVGAVTPSLPDYVIDIITHHGV